MVTRRRYAMLVAMLVAVPALAGESAKDAWKKLVIRYPALQGELDIVRPAPEVLGAALREFVAAHPDSPRTAKALYCIGRYHMSRREMSLARKTFWQCIDSFPQSRYAERSAHMIVGMYGAVGLWDGAHKQLDRIAKALPKPAFIEDLRRRLYAMEHTQKGKPPIPFEVSGLDGKPMSLAQVKGKPVMLIFWSSEDPECAAEVAAIAQWTKPFEQKGLAVLSVSLDRKVAALKKFMAEQKITWRTHCDGKGKRNALALKYDVHLLPDIYMMSEDGLLRFTGTRGRLVPIRLQKLFDRDYEEIAEDEEE